MWRLFVVFCLTSILLLVSCGSPVAPNNPPNVPNNPPNVPSNPNPANNKTDVSITTTLSWTCSDPDGDSLTYDVYFGTSPTPPLVKSNHTSTTYNPGTLNYGTKYYWKIVAKDSKGGITEGPVWNFTTMSLPSGSLSVQRSFQVSLNWVSGPIYSSPTMDRNGNLYLGTQGGLVKMDYNGDLIRSTPTASPVWSSPVVDWRADKVYFADIIGNLFAFGYGNRRITNNTIYSAPVIKDNNIYVVDLAGDVLRVTPDLNSYQTLVSLQREVRSSPAVLGNKLFVASVDGRVCAVDLASGTKLWDKLFNDEKFYGGFAIDVNGNLYIAGKRLWCLKSSDGSVNWSYELDGQAYANPVISSNGVIYIGDTSGTFGTLHAVDLNGSRRWKKTGLRSIVSSAVIGNNGIVYVCSDWIFAINPYDGSIISSLELQNFVESNPILHSGKIYVADEAGYFYVIRALSETIEDPGTSWPMFQRDWYHTATR
jgi:hypothetical protein